MLPLLLPLMLLLLLLLLYVHVFELHSSSLLGEKDKWIEQLNDSHCLLSQTFSSNFKNFLTTARTMFIHRLIHKYSHFHLLLPLPERLSVPFEQLESTLVLFLSFATSNIITAKSLGCSVLVRIHFVSLYLHFLFTCCRLVHLFYRLYVLYVCKRI